MLTYQPPLPPPHYLALRLPQPRVPPPPPFPGSGKYVTVCAESDKMRCSRLLFASSVAGSPRQKNPKEISQRRAGGTFSSAQT